MKVLVSENTPFYMIKLDTIKHDLAALLEPVLKRRIWILWGRETGNFQGNAEGLPNFKRGRQSWHT
jgi:hypothetical protein